MSCSRSGYSDACEGSALAMWRGQVASAIRGKRGQAFLRDLVMALDTMSEKKLITDDLIKDGEVCAIGSVGIKRGIDLKPLDPEGHYKLAKVFDIARPLVCEIEFENDDGGPYKETPEARWQRMRNWAAANIRQAAP